MVNFKYWIIIINAYVTILNYFNKDFAMEILIIRKTKSKIMITIQSYGNKAI